MTSCNLPSLAFTPQRLTGALRNAALTLIALSAAAASQAAGADWPQGGHDAAHTYANVQETGLPAKGFSSLALLWSRSIGSNPGAVAVVGDRIFHCDGATTDVAALQLATGSTQWSYSNGLFDGTCANPATGNGKVYIAKNDFLDLQNTVIAVDQSTGAVQWSRLIPDSMTVGLRSATLSGSSLVIPDNRSAVHSLDPATGLTRWRAETGCHNSDASIGRGQIYVATWSGCPTAPNPGGLRVVSLDEGTGALRWSAATTADSWDAPMLLGTRLFNTTTDGWLRALNADTGAVLGSRHIQGIHWVPLVGNGDVIYAATPNTIYALDAATGATRWATTVPRAGDILSNLSLASGALYYVVKEKLGSRQDQAMLAVINAKNGKVGKQHPASLDVEYAEVSAGQSRVLVRTRAGLLYEFGKP